MLERKAISPLTSVRIIIFALVTGVVAFAAVVLLVPPSQFGIKVSGGRPILTYACLAIAFTMLVARTLCLKLLQRPAFRKVAIDHWVSIHRIGSPDAAERARLLFVPTKMMGAAPIEMGAFFALICYLIERQPLTLGCAAFMLAFLIWHIPSREEYEKFVEEEQARQRDVGRGSEF